MDDYVMRQEEVDAVPFWERANIRPRELAALRLRVKQLEEAEGRAKQAEAEVDAQNDLIKGMFQSLGFYDWSYSEQGAEDAFKALNELVTGKMTVEEFGDNCESPEDSFDRNLVKLVLRVKELESRSLTDAQWTALIEVLEECKVWTARLDREGYQTMDLLYNQIVNMIALCEGAAA